MSGDLKLVHSGTTQTPKGYGQSGGRVETGRLDFGGGGTQPPDMEHRLSVVESDVKDIKTVLARMEPKLSEMHTFAQATLPHLATKTEVSEMRADLSRDIGDLKATLTTLPHLATKTEVSEMRADLSRDIGDLKATLTTLPLLATKTEVSEMRADLSRDIGDLKATLTTLPLLATKAEVSEMRSDLSRDIGDLKVTLSELPSRTYMWAVVAVLSATILAAAALK
jgi:hypothetical protein